MSIGLLFWILMIIAFVFSTWTSWPNYRQTGGNLLVFILFALIGWAVFGAAVHR